MRLVIDGTPLCYPLTGIGNYTNELLGAISEIRPSWELIIVAPYFPIWMTQKENIIFNEHASHSKKIAFKGWRAYWFSALLPTVLNKLKPDVFWAADGLMPYRISRIPCALTIYDFVPERFPDTMALIPRYLRRINRRSAINRAAWLLPISNSISAELKEMYSLDASSVIEPGVSNDFRLRPWCGRESKIKYIAYLGTLEPRKNVLTMLLCINRLADEGIWPEGLELRIVGAKGWKNTQAIEMIDILEKKNIVKLVGYLPRDALPAFLAEAQALFMPSLYEGFGMPVAEAVCIGCPVVCSDIPSFREIASADNAIFHGVDYKSMLSTYRRVIQNLSALKNERKSGAADKFTWRNSALKFIQTISP